jgi:hypothetical protein
VIRHRVVQNPNAAAAGQQGYGRVNYTANRPASARKNRPGLPVKPTCSPRDLNYRYGFGWEPDRSMYRGRTHRFREPGPGVCYARAVPERPSLALRLSTYHTRRRNEQRFCRSQDIKIHTPFNVSISRVQNFAHNISIPMDKDRNKGVGG